jgi:hypothetical protein
MISSRNRDAPLRFCGIARDARQLRWRGEVSADDGATWRLNVEFFARRVDPA